MTFFIDSLNVTEMYLRKIIKITAIGYSGALIIWTLWDLSKLSLDNQKSG